MDNTIQKPNDMFVAALSSPQATTLDLLRNNINASNTSLLSPDQYKETPLVQKRYTSEQGVFDEDAFNRDYMLAYQKFSDLASNEAMKNLADDLEFSPSDRFKPITSGKEWDTSTVYRKLKNPLQQKYSVEGINTISAPEITKQEAAQNNYIFDPEQNKFLDVTPESMNLFKKFNGDTLIYAKWDNEGYHLDPETGDMVLHHIGDWKTDKNGNYYTEILGNRELGTNEVVGVQDILTKEGSMLNKIDFFDSDDMDKSNWGIAMKTMITMLPYVVPGPNAYYAGLTTVFGLASVMPTFYKSLESLIMGEQETAVSPTVTRMENWFRKFEATKSEKGRQSFWTVESLGELVADTFGQLYQQRAAASASKWFMGEAPKLGKVSQQEYIDYWTKSNKLSKALNLGYMGLISTSNIYNDAINAGYDKRTAGIATLASAAASFGIMNFNETANGLGTWFLDKTTGYNREIENGIIRKLAKEEMGNFAEGVSKMQANGDRKALADVVRNFKTKLNSRLEDVFVIGGEGIWKNALVEGVEEVTEEVVQDSIKGIVDTMSWLGWTAKEGSFGGWDNVFSKQGLERYVSTFVGGAIGGALFQANTEFLEPALTGRPRPSAADYSLNQAILEGRTQEILDQIDKHKKYFNTKQGATLGKLSDGKSIYMTTQDGEHTSQADIIADLAKRHVIEQATLITRGINPETLRNDPAKHLLYQQVAKQYQDSGFEENYIKDRWDKLVSQVLDAQKKVDSLRSAQESTKKKSSEKSESEDKTKKSESKKQDSIDNLKQAEQELLKLQQELYNWHSGENF